MLLLEGEELPNVLRVEINGITYLTSLNEELLNSLVEYEYAEAQPTWLVQNEDNTQTLMIPAELMTRNSEISISGEYYDTLDLASLTYADLN